MSCHQYNLRKRVKYLRLRNVCFRNTVQTQSAASPQVGFEPGSDHRCPGTRSPDAVPLPIRWPSGDKQRLCECMLCNRCILRSKQNDNAIPIALDRVLKQPAPNLFIVQNSGRDGRLKPKHSFVYDICGCPDLVPQLLAEGMRLSHVKANVFHIHA